MQAQGHLPPAPVLYQSLQPPVHPTDEASLVDVQKRNNKCWPPLVPAAPDYIINIYNMGMKLFPSSGNSIFQTEKMSAEWSSSQDPPANSSTRQTPRLSLRNPQPAALVLSRSTVIVWRDSFLTTDSISPSPTPTDMCRWTQRLRNTHILTHTCTLPYMHIDIFLFITRFEARITITSFVGSIHPFAGK